MSVKVRNSVDPIVIVDDEEADVEAFLRALKKSELKNPPKSFSDGDEFLSYMETVKTGSNAMPAIVLLDINMPKMSGFEVLESIRGDKDLAPLPIVIMLTSSAQEKDIAKANDFGCDDYQVKPYSIGEFVELLNKLA